MCLLIGMSGLLHAQTNDPVLESQPSAGVAAVGETFAFLVKPNGTSPFAHQWYHNGTAIGGATNASLLLTNLGTGDAGSYFVVVTNSVGSVTSSVADLFVVTSAPRVLWVKGVAESGSNLVKVPLVLNANGREHAVDFSLRFDTNTFGAPMFTWAAGNTATILSSNVVLGELGFTVSRPAGEMFPPGQQTLGAIWFQHETNTTALDGRLAFTNQPVQVQARDTNGLEMLMAAVVVPQVEVDRGQPKLNLQTGLFEQGVRIANPSDADFTPLRLYVPSLGVDTSSNAMTWYGASGSASVDLDGDGVLEPAAYVTLTNLAPGAVLSFTNGFYVTDHVTSPVVDYYLGVGGTPGDPMPATLVPLRILSVDFENGHFAMEWPTRPNRVYSVHYAGDVMDLGDPGLVATSTNTVVGTGSPVQWVDKTPVEARRYYQVIESP